MKSGTLISAPVSRVAGLVPPVERSPCRPGSVCLTTSSTVTGSSTKRGTSSWVATWTAMFSSRKRDWSPTVDSLIDTWS
ncbi:Uncharacterised protein [Mycobacteroides abscessus subsp. abscessus]|nr:Uncharacterised protein [Mycobacteroides abscessus subsp. abscessus]